MWKRLAAGLVNLAAIRRSASADAKQGTPATENFQAVDVPLHPKFKRVPVDGRVIDLLHGSHLDDLLRDTPDIARPPSLLYIHDGSAPDRPDAVTVTGFAEVGVSGQFGDRERLLIAEHDVDAAKKRIWFHITPERNITHRFLRPSGETELPKLVFLPRKCNGWTQWCDPGGKERIIGGECYVEQCSDWKVIKPDSAGAWVKTVKELIEKEGTPKVWTELENLEQQSQWIRSRDTTTMRENLELLHMPRSLPRFTKKGFKLVDIPADIHERMVQGYLQMNKSGGTEPWNTWGQTQVNCYPDYEGTIRIVSVHGVGSGSLAADIQNVMLPRLEKWVGVELEQTSLYGMREYYHPCSLRKHLDRPDVLVASVTFSVYQEGFDHKEWPLEVISFDGNTYRVEHPAGSMMYYESAVLSHGKPGAVPKGGKHVGLFLHYRPKVWAENGYVDFGRMRASRSVKVLRDGRPRHPRQEGWPAHFYETEHDRSVYAALSEGIYFSMGNKCNDPNDARDDGALKLGKMIDRSWEDRDKLGEGLLQAAKDGNLGRVEVLLKEGADVNYYDRNAWTPLHEAMRKGSAEVVAKLLAAGADATRETYGGQQTAFDIALQFHGDRRKDLLALLTTKSEL